ncbi:hypothetical protein HYU06_04220 [Candidatus Woesearchaeota archaeon]|nr:hypothetical protein [Candidatus Woesearchaeota archaeon]
MAEQIENILEKLGYAYFKIDAEIHTEEIIVKIIAEGEARFVKAIPFIIYVSQKKNNILFDAAKLLKFAKEKDVLLEAKAMLYAAIKILRITDKSSDAIVKLAKFEEWYSKQENDLFDNAFYSEKHKQFNRKARVSGAKINEFKKKIRRVYFNFDELLYEFISQKTLFEAKEQVTLAEKLNLSKERDLQYALNTLFKPKQLEIINKVADNKALSKVEYDYYFKTIKKRLRAVKLLAEFADTIIQKKVSQE